MHHLLGWWDVWESAEFNSLFFFFLFLLFQLILSFLVSIVSFLESGCIKLNKQRFSGADFHFEILHKKVA